MEGVVQQPQSAPQTNLLQQVGCNNDNDQSRLCKSNQQVRWGKLKRLLTDASAGMLVKHSGGGGTGYLIRLSGTTRDRSCTVRMYGRVDRTFRKNTVLVVGPDPSAFKGLGLLEVAEMMTITDPAQGSHARNWLRVAYNNVPGVLSRLIGHVTWLFQPDLDTADRPQLVTFGTGPGGVHQNLSSAVSSGTLEWLVSHSTSAVADPASGKRKRTKEPKTRHTVPVDRKQLKKNWHANKRGVCEMNRTEPLYQSLDMPHLQLQIEETLAALPDVKNFQVVTNHRYDWYQRKGKYAGFQRSYIFKIDPPWTAIVPTASVYPHATQTAAIICAGASAPLLRLAHTRP